MKQPRIKGQFGTTISTDDFNELKKMVDKTVVVEQIFDYLDSKYPKASEVTKYRWIERACRT